MGWLLGLIGFSVVNAVTPGPNNVLLLASGSSFGVRATVPHILGTALGIGVLALVVGAGLGVVIAEVPAVGVAMKLVGSAYLLWLALAIARSGALHHAEVARPLGVVRAAALQVVNPKVWVFALGAMSTFRPGELPVAIGTVAVAATMAAVVIPTAGLWAAGGGAFARLFSGDRTSRAVSIVLAGVVAATVVSVWL
jgi:threonine/homoserine/homoserine lactone efflux protein